MSSFDPGEAGNLLLLKGIPCNDSCFIYDNFDNY